MPRGSQFYSADMVQLVAQANKRIAAEARRQEAGGAAATEAGAVALHYAQRELTAIYGFNSGVERLSLKGVTDPKMVEKIVEAATRITESKMLTVAGRKEAHQKAMESFFDTERGKITAEQKKLYDELTRVRTSYRKKDKGVSYSLFDRLKEFAGGYNVGSIKDAVQMMVENGLTSEDISKTIRNYIRKNAPKMSPESIYDYLAEKYPDMEWQKEEK